MPNLMPSTDALQTACILVLAFTNICQALSIRYLRRMGAANADTAIALANAHIADYQRRQREEP